MGLKRVARRPNKIFAITVGIDKYKYWAPLQSAVNDADLIKDYLSNEFDSVESDNFHIRNEDVTVENIKNIFKNSVPEKLQKTEEEVDVFAFFACHGMVRDGKGYLIPVNVDVNPRLSECINIQKDILNICKVKNFPARAVFLAFATCHSGIALKDTWSESDEDIQPVQILAAGKTAQSIPDSYRDQNNSLFTLALLDGLQGKAEVGLQGDSITGSELIGYVRAEVYSKSRELGLPQDPQGGFAQTNSSGDEFVLIPRHLRISFEIKKLLDGNANSREEAIRRMTNEAKEKDIIWDVTQTLSRIIEKDPIHEVRLRGIGALSRLNKEVDGAAMIVGKVLLDVTRKYIIFHSTEQIANSGNISDSQEFYQESDTWIWGNIDIGTNAVVFSNEDQETAFDLLHGALKTCNKYYLYQVDRAILEWMNPSDYEFEYINENVRLKTITDLAETFWIQSRRKQILKTMIEISLKREAELEELNPTPTNKSSDAWRLPITAFIKYEDELKFFFQLFRNKMQQKHNSQYKEFLVEAMADLGLYYENPDLSLRAIDELIAVLLDKRNQPIKTRYTVLTRLGNICSNNRNSADINKDIDSIIMKTVQRLAKNSREPGIRNACMQFLKDIEEGRLPFGNVIPTDSDKA